MQNFAQKTKFFLVLCADFRNFASNIGNMKTNPLIKMRNVPVSSGTLQNLFRELKSPEEKIRALEKDGQLIRLKRGLYVVNTILSGIETSVALCANHIYGPSYISLRWALRHYGLIPERFFTTTSVTTKRSRTFENQLGRFTYYQTAPEYFAVGVTSNEEHGVCYLVATPEKALCDMIVYDSYVPDRSIIALERYLDEDLRFDTDALRDFDPKIIAECAAKGRKKGVLENLIKMIGK